VALSGARSSRVWRGGSGRVGRSLFSIFHEKKNYSILIFMKTVVVANQKGGSGKSTITVHLAPPPSTPGMPHLLSDTDPQGTSGDWFNQRKKSGFDTPLYASLALSELRARSGR